MYCIFVFGLKYRKLMNRLFIWPNLLYYIIYPLEFTLLDELSILFNLSYWDLKDNFTIYLIGLVYIFFALLWSNWLFDVNDQ